MKNKLVPGNRFPDIELPDHNNELQRLSELQGKDPLILILCRCCSCKRDREQLKQMVQFYPQCELGKVKVVSISTDGLDKINDFRNSINAKWSFLSDSKRKIAKGLEIEEFTSDKRYMIPHTLVLKPKLKIFRVYNGYWYWGRPSINELHQDLRIVSSQIRPDYIINTPQMKLKWDNNQFEEFYPYDKKSREEDKKIWVEDYYTSQD